MTALSLRLPDDLTSRLDTESGLDGRGRSEVVREAIEQYLTRRERERRMAGFVAETRAIYADPVLCAEALALAAEGLQTSNEALDVAERSGAPRSGRPVAVRK